VLAVLAVAALLLGLTRCGADGGLPATPPTARTPTWGTGAPAPDPAGSLTAAGTSLFAAAQAPGGLVALGGRTASGRAVPVQSVAADEGFWIGADATDRVWVLLASDDESSLAIADGALLDLSGRVVTHGADFARKAGVSAEEGAEQLTRQGAHLEVDPSQVTVVGAR
jgi:hypothetical protein